MTTQEQPYIVIVPISAYTLKVTEISANGTQFHAFDIPEQNAKVLEALRTMVLDALFPFKGDSFDAKKLNLYGKLVHEVNNIRVIGDTIVLSRLRTVMLQLTAAWFKELHMTEPVSDNSADRTNGLMGKLYVDHTILGTESESDSLVAQLRACKKLLDECREKNSSTKDETISSAHA